MSHPFLNSPVPPKPGPDEDLADIAAPIHPDAWHARTSGGSDGDGSAHADDDAMRPGATWSDGDDNDGWNRDESRNPPPDHDPGRD